jgi:hypothetical protein
MAMGHDDDHSPTLSQMHGNGVSGTYIARMIQEPPKYDHLQLTPSPLLQLWEKAAFRLPWSIE